MTNPKKKKKGGDPRWDHFAQKAQDRGYKARSVFKLMEIDQRFSLFHPGRRVLDLGCHPGSWLQYAAEKVGPAGQVVGIDRTETEAPRPNIITIQADLTQPLEHGALAKPFDVVLSDMAPDTTGIRHVDQDRSMMLAEIALDYAVRLGRIGSAFIVKIFQGPEFQKYMASIRQHYSGVRCVRPEATRKTSIEVYVVATGKKTDSHLTHVDQPMQ